MSSLISREEYQLRVSTLFEEFKDQLSQNYGLETPYGWLSTLEDMFIYLDVVVDSNSKDKVRFLQIKEKFSDARIYWGRTVETDKSVTKLITKIINQYEETVSKKCVVCGAPGKLINSSGYLLKLCPEHSHY